MSPDPANINQYWAELIVEELVRCGCSDFFLAPGSRSTPLVAAVVKNPRADGRIHFDERGTAFMALGYGKRTGRPAAWITTSGTAVANGFPAVVEASQARVPLLLLTSDRPFELRASGANQAIDQVKLFGDYVRAAFDVPAPDRRTPPASLLTLVGQIHHRAHFPEPGPVHANIQFREPLAPDPGPVDIDTEALRSWRDSGNPYTTYVSTARVPDPTALQDVRRAVTQASRGLLVVGCLPDRDSVTGVMQLAEALGWPVAADVTSQIRLGASSPMVIDAPHFQLKEERMRPDVIVRIGSPPSSKSLNTFVRLSSGATIVNVPGTSTRVDPDHNASFHVASGIPAFCELARDWHSVSDPSWVDHLTARGRGTSAFAALIGPDARVTEPGVARRLTQLIPADQDLFVASSMPVRDLDMFADGGGASVWVGANRGASGIDGTLASAVGAAMGSSSRATVLIGDLALLHDLNSLSLMRDRRDIVIVFNNDGGGIFSFLPIARHVDLFEDWFGTPHGITFAAAAELFELRYERPDTIGAFSQAYDRALESDRSTLIEITTDRRENLQLHRRLEEDFAAAAG